MQNNQSILIMWYNVILQYCNYLALLRFLHGQISLWQNLSLTQQSKWGFGYSDVTLIEKLSFSYFVGSTCQLWDKGSANGIKKHKCQRIYFSDFILMQEKVFKFNLFRRILFQFKKKVASIRWNSNLKVKIYDLQTNETLGDANVCDR